MDILKTNLNLMKCAIDEHDYSEPIVNETLQSLKRKCSHCGKEIKLHYENLKQLEEKKLNIVTTINDNYFIRAKILIDNLLKEFK